MQIKTTGTYCKNYNNTEQLLQQRATTTATCRLKQTEKHTAYISSSTTATSTESYRNIQGEPLQHGKI
jgi:hypothetical protein